MELKNLPKIGKTSLDILNYVKVENNILTWNNLEYSLEMPVSMPDGIYCTEHLRKGMSAEAAKSDILTFTEFPECVGHGKELNASCSPSVEMFNYMDKAKDFVSVNFSTRVNLTGIYLDGGAVVATDGHRLFKGETFIPDGFENIILPLSVVDMMKKEKCAPETMELFGNEFKVVCLSYTSGLKHYVNLIEGPYPNYAAAIPDGGKTISFDRLDLLDRLKTMLPYSNEKNHRVAFDKGIIFTSKNEKLFYMDGGPMFAVSAGFNIEYLIQCLECLSADRTTCIYTSAIAAFRFKDYANEGITTLAMPLSLTGEGKTEVTPGHIKVEKVAQKTKKCRAISAPIEKTTIAAPVQPVISTPTIATPEPEKAIVEATIEVKPAIVEITPEPEPIATAPAPAAVEFKVMEKPKTWKESLFELVEKAIQDGATTEEMNRALCYAIYSQKVFNQKEA